MQCFLSFFLFVASLAEVAQAFRDVLKSGDMDADGDLDMDGADVEESSTTFSFLKLRLPPGAVLAPLPEADPHGTSELQQSAVTKGFPEELEWFKQYKGVKEQWLDTLTTQKPSSTSLAILDQVKTWKVPGLRSVRFAEVFDAVQKKCPLWIVGGAARDLIVGDMPNDIDCIALCKTSTVAMVAKRMGWIHKYQRGQAYFAIGEAHGDNPNYLEGFSGDLLFEHADMAEMTTSILLWGLSDNTIVDPSGKGVDDAKNKLLRPAVPEGGKSAKDLWHDRHVWLFGGFSGPRLTRHVRYLKMRIRGWEPADKCVRDFMANVLAAMSKAELGRADYTGRVQAFGFYWPNVPMATLMMLADKYGKESLSKQSSVILKLTNVYSADMSSYFAGAADHTCSSTWTPPYVTKTDPLRSPRNWKEVMSTLIRECDHISFHDPRGFMSTFAGICKAAKSIYNQLKVR